MKVFKNRYEAEMDDAQLWITDMVTGWTGSFEAAEADMDFRGGDDLLTEIATHFNY